MPNVMLLFSAETPPITSPLISIVIEQQIEVPPVEYTLEEKIKLNVNNCNTDIQYIRADDATCLDKPVYVPTQTQSPAREPVNSPQATSNWFPKGQCTWYVASRRPVGKWNNASDWKWQAQRDGWTISSTPIAGAIGWTYGHVVYVEAVNSDGTVTISEANYDYRSSIRTITVATTKYQYIY